MYLSIMEKFAELLISTSPEEILCDEHERSPNSKDEQCSNCLTLQEKVRKYQTHGHTFTCAKKRKCLTIKETEGHGRLDGLVKGPLLSNISVCRFKFPKFPLNETKVVLGLSKDAEEDFVKTCKADLRKITNYLIRQTHKESMQTENENWDRIKFTST